MGIADKNASPKEAKKGKLGEKSNLVQILKRMFENKGAVVGLIIMVAIIAISLAAPLLAPYGYAEMNMPDRLATPSLRHLFGADELGRDIFSRILYGGRISLILAFGSSALSAVAGILLGSVAGYFGGWVDNLLMRAMDVVQAIPSTLFAVVVSAALGSGIFETVLALSIASIPAYCRVMRGSILTVRKNEYIDAARADNSSAARIIRKHILPNAISPMIVQITMTCANNILIAAGLSFLGLGVQPPNAEWGAMLSAGRSFLREYPHTVIFPGIAIMLLVLSFNLIGDALRDALDPKLKH